MAPPRQTAAMATSQTSATRILRTPPTDPRVVTRHDPSSPRRTRSLATAHRDQEPHAPRPTTKALPDPRQCTQRPRDNQEP